MKTSNGRQRRWMKGMESAWSVPLAASAGLLVLSMHSEAEACDCAPSSSIEKSLPEDGALGVPTDVVIWVQGGDVELIDEAGDVVPSHLEQKDAGLCDRSQLLTPDAELAPSSTYTLRTVSESDDALDGDAVAEISFTTGAVALAGDAPSKPGVRVAAFDASNYLNTCVYSQSQVCMQASYEGLIDVHLTASGSERHYVGYPEMLANLEFGEDAGETCLLVQARDLAGRLSEAVELCVDFSSAPVMGRGDGDGDIYLDCSDEQLEPYYVSSDEDPVVPDDVDEDPAVPDDVDEDPAVPDDVDEDPAVPDDVDESSGELADEDKSSEASGCSVSSSTRGAQSPWGFGLMGGFVSLLLLVRRRRLGTRA